MSRTPTQRQRMHRHLAVPPITTHCTLQFLRMPELKELIHAILRACRMWNHIRRENFSTCRIKALLYDATDTEQQTFNTGSRLRNGFVDVLDPSYKVKRGSRLAQSALWPSMIPTSGDLHSLELTKITGSYRSLILVFGDVAVLQVRSNDNS